MLPEWLSTALTPYAAVERGGSRLPALVERHLSHGSMAEVKQLAFVLLRPEALRSHRAAELLDYLESNYSIVPVQLRIATLTNDAVETLYRLRLPAWLERTWLHEDSFATGPAAALLLRGPAAEHPTLCERLDAIKGPTAFAADTPGENLRARFRRPSSIHAVLHVSSDVGAFFHEASLFFPWHAIRDAVESPAPIPADVRRALLDCDPPPDASVFEVLLSIKARIYAALELRSPAPAGMRVSVGKQLQALAGMSPSQQRAAFEAFSAIERPALAKLLAQSQTLALARLQAALATPPARVAETWTEVEASWQPVELLYAAWFLSGNEACDPERARSLIERLQRNDVPVSPWARTLVHAGLRIDLRHGLH
jgi:hypothetical protein